MTLKQKIQQIQQWLHESDGSDLWDLMGCVRGPDFPSEAPNQSGPEQSRNHTARRARKMDTIAVIRGKVWGPAGGAILRTDRDYVMLPPKEEWTHFDRHVARGAAAASRAGIPIEVKIKSKPANEKKVVFKTAEQEQADAKAKADKEAKAAEAAWQALGLETPPGILLTTFKSYYDMYGGNSPEQMQGNIEAWDKFAKVHNSLAHAQAVECMQVLLKWKKAQTA